MEGFEILACSDIWDEVSEANTQPEEQRPKREKCVTAGQLCKVVQRGDVKRVEELLRARSWSDLTLLDALNHVRCVDAAIAIAREAPGFFLQEGGAEALFTAAKGGRVDAVRALLAFGVPVDASPTWNTQGVSALHLAAAYGSARTATALLEAGADVHAATQGVQALHLAAYFGHKECIESLLDGGASVEATDADGWRPLHHAAGNGFVECVRVFLDRGANPDAPGRYDDTPLLLTARGYTNVYLPHGVYSHTAHLEAEYSRCVELLVQRGADVNLANEEGRTPLTSALKNHGLDTITSLISAGADIWAKNNIGETVLHEAVLSRSSEADYLSFFVKLGLDVNAQAHDGSTPLHNAVRMYYDDVVETLIYLGADVNLQDYEGCTPLHLSAAYENTTILQMLLEAGAEVNHPSADGTMAVHCAAQSSLPCLKVLLAAGADLTARVIDGRTVVHFAASAWQTECFETLRALGLDLQVVDERGWTCLHYAVSVGQMENVQWLLHHEFILTCRTFDGSTPLHVAAGVGSSWIVKELLHAHKAPLEAVDHLGRTPLHKAAMGSDEDMVRTLLESGAVRHVRDVHGETPAQLAALPEIRRIIERWALGA